MPQLAEKIEALNKAFHDFKAANDERLSQIEKKGHADPLIEEKVNRANDDISKYHAEIQTIHAQTTERMDQLEAMLNRSGRSAANDPTETFAKAKQFFSQIRGEEVPDSQVDIKAYEAYGPAFNAYLRRGDKAITADKMAALSVGSDPDGGYWVTPDTSGTTQKLIYETSPVRQVASVVTIGTDALEGYNDLDEAGTGWVSETAARPETTTPGIGKWRIPVHEQYAEPRATQKTLDDASFMVEAWLGDKVGMKLARTENTGFVVGNGEGKPRGFMTYAAGTPSATTWNVIQQVNSGSAAALTGDGLIDLVFSLKAFYRNNANFMMNRSTVAAVRKLKDGQGNYLWQPEFTARQGGQLLGYSIVEAEDMVDVAANSLSIAFGDFRMAYQIVDRTGIRVLRDPYTTKGYVKFYTTKRVGGDVVNFEAIKIQKTAA